MQQLDLKLQGGLSTSLESWLNTVVGHLTKHQSTINSVLVGGLCLVSVWTAGETIWLTMEKPTAPTWQPAPIQNQATRTQDFDSRVIKQKNLFGIYQKDAPVAVKKEVVNAPKTKLNLKLVGVVVSDNAHGNLAIVSNHGKQATYGVDEAIDGTRAILSDVFDDRIIINNAGSMETVMLDGAKFTPREQSESHTVTTKNLSQGISDNAPKGNNRNTKSKLEAIKKEIANNPQTLFQYIRLSQMKRDNAVIGYRLSPGRSPELFRSVGLENGDVAIRVNDIDLTDKQAIVRVGQTLSNLSEMKITVQRQGQPYDIYIQF